MEAALLPVSLRAPQAIDHPRVPEASLHSAPTQSLAVAVQLGNASIAQTVGANKVSSPLPAGVAAALAAAKPREFVIQGITSQGKTFRPSDWAERLAGAMSCFRPGGGRGGVGANIGYSPYCVPTSMGDIKCVLVSESLRKIEPMAWDFVMSFAKDNDLQVAEACLLPSAQP